MSLTKKLLTIVAPVALLALGACTTGLTTQVSRFQAMPAPQGQTFAIQASDRDKDGGIEFGTYANIIRQNLVAQGYSEASSPRAANLVVTFDYGVDNGRERLVSTPDPWGAGWGGGWGGWGGYGRPYYSRFGYYGRYHNPFFWGWGGDPFWGNDYVTSYTIYTSHLDMNIRRAGDGQSVFEGHAQARSQSNELPALVPNLIEAMFTNFPGNSGETVRITVMPEHQAHR
jgi:hypothetical protein